MYSKTHWQDRVVDPETGEVVQEGTFMSAEHFNNMEDGIEANDTAISEISESVETIETTLDTGVGTTITLTVNSSTFVMKLALKNSEGDILSESEVDLPIESMIVNAEYVEATKSLVLTLQSGSKVTVPLSALINGLVNDTRKVAGMDLKKDITVAEMVTALGVDKKANKTEVSSSNETTSVINVTDAKAQMAMVAKISGKTVKSKNRYNADNLITKWSGKVSKNSTGEYTINVDSVMYSEGISASEFSATSPITVSCKMKLGTATNVRIDIVYTDGTVTTSNASTVTTEWANIKATSYKEVARIRFNWSGTGTVLMKEFQIESGGTQTVYEPYFDGLHSAPVESVVSVGKNRVEKDKIEKNCLYNTNGRNNYNGVDTSDLIKVTPGKDYWCGMFDNTGTRIADVVITTFSSESSINAIREIKNNSHITPASGENYIRVRNDSSYSTYITSGNYVFVVAEGTASIFIPYNKTTVLVPSEARNCVGYGLGISDSVCNIYDCENSVYTQMLNEVDFGSLSSWSYNTSTKEFSIAKPSDCPAGVWTEVPSILTGKYTTYSNQYFDANTATLNNAICLTATSLKIKDTAYTNADTLKAALTGQKLVYKLASTVTKALTDFIRPLPVEAGGTLTLVNEHNLDVNSTIKYKKEVN